MLTFPHIRAVSQPENCVWLYEVINHSQYVTYSRRRLARPQFAEAAGVPV